MSRLTAAPGRALAQRLLGLREQHRRLAPGIDHRIDLARRAAPRWSLRPRRAAASSSRRAAPRWRSFARQRQEHLVGVAEVADHPLDRQRQQLEQRRGDDDAVGQRSLRVLEQVDDFELVPGGRSARRRSPWRLAIARTEFGAFPATYRRNRSSGAFGRGAWPSLEAPLPAFLRARP